MYLNNFSVRIPEGNETPGGYVELSHNQQYSLVLKNNRHLRCDARIEVDGKHLGTFRIPKHETITLDRPAHDTGKLTFYEIGTVEGNKIGLTRDDPNLGLVKITFTPEKDEVVTPLYDSGIAMASMSYSSGAPAVRTRTSVSHNSSKSRSAGGTGLSGKSNQTFAEAYALDLDYSQQTVIHLRLVSRSNDPRPLTTFSTPIPPSV